MKKSLLIILSVLLCGCLLLSCAAAPASQSAEAPISEAPAEDAPPAEAPIIAEQPTEDAPPAETPIIAEPPAAQTQQAQAAETLTAVVLDVGQGDSIFLSLPDGKTMLIDAGEKTAAQTILQDLADLGVTALDYAVATHPHADHIGGMETIIKQLPIGAFYMPDKAHTTNTFERMIDALQNKNVDTFSATAGDIIAEGSGYKIEVLAPSASQSGDNLNNYSIVLKVTNGNDVLLFTGDAESAVEDGLSDIDTDFLKVSHHGSSTGTDTAFLEKTTPEIAVISVGSGNKYGHPHSETLAALEAAGAKVYRTDASGIITAVSGGNGISVTTEK